MSSKPSSLENAQATSRALRAVAQDASESATELRVAVMEYVSLAAESAAFHIGEVATHLLDPRLRRMGVTPASVTRLVSSWMTNRT
jgi:hypothetical protein